MPRNMRKKHRHEETNNKNISCRKICELNIGHEETNDKTSHAGKYAN